VPSRKAIRGRLLKVDAPEWEPLLNLAPDHVDDFMWMGTVQLTDGTRLQVYKHYWTRSSLRLAADGRAFVFVPKTRYEEVNPPWLLMRVLRKELDPGLRYSVRQNVWPEEAEIMGKVRKQKKKAEEELAWETSSGAVITEEVAEQMAEEFERDGLDLAKVERRYVGRPSLGPNGPSPRVSFRAPPELYKAAWARADKEGRSLSDLAREAFTRYMES